MERRTSREKSGTAGDRRQGAIVGVLLLAAVAIGLVLPGEARAQAHAQVEEFSVELEHAWLSRDGGRYYLDYEVSHSHWEYARQRGLDLYVGAYLPDERDGYDFTHAVRLTSRDGYVRFPDHLKYHRGWQLGIGLVAVSHGAHYSSGSGFVVQGPMVLDVHSYRRRLGGPTLRFGLVYHRRLSHYGWYGPRFGFKVVIGSHRPHYRKKVIIQRNHRRVIRHERYQQKKHHYRKHYRKKYHHKKKYRHKKHHRSHRPKVIHHRKEVHHRRHHRSNRPKVIHYRKKVIHHGHRADRRGQEAHHRKKANRHRAKKRRSHRRHRAKHRRSHRRHEANRGGSHRRHKAGRSGRSRSDRAKRGSRGKSRSEGDRSRRHSRGSRR